MTEAAIPRGKQTGFGSRRYVQRFTPFAVWCGAIVAVLWLLPAAVRTGGIIGLVDAPRTAVVVPVAGTLVAMAADRHQRVEAGQVVGRLSDDDLRLRLAAARCELERLRADLREREVEVTHAGTLDDARRKLDMATELRRRTSEVEGARLDELETQAEIAEARVRLRGLAVEVDRQTTLERQGIAADAALVRVRTDQDALEKRISELEGILVERRARVVSARQRQDEFAAVEGVGLQLDVLLEPMRWRLKAQETEIERIALDGRKLDLVAPVAGSVEAVHFTTGQWVASGATLLTIVDSEARRIVAYVPETVRARVPVASTVHVVRDAVPGRRPAVVLSMSPAVVLMPQRLWRDPRQEEWAWEIVLASGGDEAPGERVRVLPLQ